MLICCYCPYACTGWAKTSICLWICCEFHLSFSCRHVDILVWIIQYSSHLLCGGSCLHLCLFSNFNLVVSCAACTNHQSNLLLYDRPTVWTVSSEVFPLHIRGKLSDSWLVISHLYLSTVIIGVANSVAISSFYLFTSIVNQFIPYLLGFVQVHGFFYIVAGVNLLSIFFILSSLPETKVSHEVRSISLKCLIYCCVCTQGVSLEEIDALFSHGSRKSALPFLK